MAQKQRAIDLRRRHFFRTVAALGALAPLAIMGAKEASAAPIYGDPPRTPPGAGPNCFLKGTRILTERGEVAIECLRVGDLVMTAAGAFRPIKGIGRSSFRKGEVWGEEDVAPVCIVASAISPGVPALDLYLSPGHALFLDGHLIPVKYLVNGLTITQQEVAEGSGVEYLHLVFENHEAICANGLTVESLLVTYAGEPNDLFAVYEDDGDLLGPMVSYAPLLGYFGGRQEAIAFARLAVYPWIDVRDRIQVVYDRLVERAQLVRDIPEIADAA